MFRLLFHVPGAKWLVTVNTTEDKKEFHTARKNEKDSSLSEIAEISRNFLPSFSHDST